MTKTKKNIFALAIAFLIIIIMAVLYGCNEEKKQEPYTTLGHGSVIEEVDETSGVKTYKAVADEWNVFSGWYNGLDRYSTQSEIVVTKNTPKGLVAKFETSGTLSADRVLKGAYNNYVDAVETKANYLNLSFDTSVSVAGSLVTETFEADSGLYLSLDGTGFQVYSTIKDNDQPVSSWYYVDDSENSMLYLDLNGEKVAVEDFETIGSKIIDVPNASSAVWNLKDILGNGLFSQIENYIGFRNSVGFIDSVENAPNQTKIDLNVDEFLNALKDVLPSINDPKLEGFKDVIESLTNQYPGLANKLPEITLSLTIDFEKNEGKESVKSITVKATFDDEYKLQIGENVVTIPACTAEVVISNMQMQLSATPNAVPEEIIQTFPEAVHAGNVHSEGVLTFAKENVATLELSVIDEYKIELDSNININFLKDAIKEDGSFDTTKIDWNKFGFLSFRISLIENPNDSTQSVRHNGSTEYLNLLIDTEKFGTKAFVYVDLYNPKTLNGMGTTTYIVNASYDLPELLIVMPEVIENLNGSQSEPAVVAAEGLDDKSNLIADIISDIINEILNISGKKTADEILFDMVYAMLCDIAPENSLIKDGLSYSEFGQTLAVEEVKDLIDEEFSAASSTLGSLELHNNIFGEKTTHIAIKTTDFSYGTVVKNEQGEYEDESGKTFVERYNEKHITLVGVRKDSAVAGLTDKTYTLSGLETELKSLVGTNVIVEGVFSDGTTSLTYKNCQGNDVQIELKIYSYSFQMVDANTAEISVYLTFCTGTLQSVLVNTFDIPYGLVKFTFNANVA